MANRSRTLENKWTPEEDVILSQAVTACGSKICWGKVASRLAGRTNKSCRKRWIHSLDPSLRKGRWTPSEDALLLTAIRNHGRHWYRVAEMLPGRTDDQCAKRWREKLDPSIRRDPWTEAEDRQLLNDLESHGKRWNVISRYLKGRPAVHCRNRWLSLVRAGRAVDNGNTSTLGGTPGNSAVDTPQSTGSVEDACTPETKGCHLSYFTDMSLLENSPSPSAASSLSSHDPLMSSWDSGRTVPVSSPMITDDQHQQATVVNLPVPYDSSTLDLNFDLLFDTPDPGWMLHNHEQQQITSLQFLLTPSSSSQSNGVYPSCTNNMESSKNAGIIGPESSPHDMNPFNNWDSISQQQQQQHSGGSSSPPKTTMTPISSQSISSDTEESFRMTCPLPFCQFQSDRLIQIWRHITWEHVGNKNANTDAIMELVEKAVTMGCK